MVTLTGTSEQLCKQHLAFFQEFEQTLQSDLTEEELKQFFAITEKLKKNLE
jgi:DNA-binding MarR family transcriptional regulator